MSGHLNRSDPGIAPVPYPGQAVERLQERLRQASIKKHGQVHVLRGDLEQLLGWIETRNGTKGQSRVAVAGDIM